MITTIMLYFHISKNIVQLNSLVTSHSAQVESIGSTHVRERRSEPPPPGAATGRRAAEGESASTTQDGLLAGLSSLVGSKGVDMNTVDAVREFTV